MATNHGSSPSIQVAMEEIRSLQKKVTTMEKERAEQNVDSDDESLIESQPFHQSLWDSKVLDNFKSPHLPTFDGKTDPVEHLMVVGTQTAIIGAPEHLRSKLLSGTLKDAALRWYMNLPINSIESYADFHKKFIHQLSGTKHVKVTATSLFTIRQSYAETLREYLTRFSEATITVSNSNQEMFVTAFHNGLKAGHFNESLAQKPATSMQEVVKRVSCYIKGEESNAEKRSRDAKEKDSRSTGLAPLPPPRMHNTIMGPDTDAWCAYHRCKGHDTERCFRLRDQIEELIRSGHLRKFLEDAAKGQIAFPKQTPNQQKGEGDSRNKGEKQRVAFNTISGGFAGGGESNSARKGYVRKSKFEICSVGSSTFPRTPEISFNPEDARDILPHDDDPLVIQVQILNRDNPYSGTLVGFTGEQVDVMGHIMLYTTFGEDENAKTIKVRYLVVKTLFTSYNIIIGRTTFNALGAVMSTLCLSIKYPLNNGKVGVAKGDQVLARKCYESSLKIRHRPSKPVSPPVSGERVSPIEDLEQVQIGEHPHQTTSIGTSLQPEEREKIITILRNNRDLFAWHPSDMPGIDESVTMHKLSISPANKPVVQRKRKVGEDRRTSITEEVAKLKEAGFIEEIKYPVWLANVVMVKKANGKWRMCVDFTDLNKACPKDPYPLPNIDRLIDGASGATYQRLMDRVFVEQIRKNLEVYIEDMVVKTQKEGEHDQDLDDILKGIEENPDKCQAIINMRSPTFVKEVQQLTGRIAAFSSKTLRGVETRYQKIERLCLAVVITARKLRQYFQSHQVIVKTDYSIKNVLRKPDLAGRMVAWSVEFPEFDITYVPRGPIKSQALADFVLEMTDPPSEGEAHPWTLSVDGSSNLRGGGAGVAEYEALIAGMKLAKEMEVQELKVKGMAKKFTMFELTYVPREQNARADLLAKLASTKKPGNHRTVIQETLKSPSINEAEIALVVEEQDWQSPIIRYLQMDALPLARDEAAKIKKMAAWYTLVGGKLYKRSFIAPMLLCVSNTEACRILKEVHEGSCGSHIRSRSLAGKVMRAGFYWPNLHDDAARHVRTCDRCQRHSNLHHAPGEPLKSVLSPWPFYMWGVDILGPFPISTAQARWILVAVDYFTKWVEAEPISGELGGTPSRNIVVISHNVTVFNGGTTLHHGLWSRGYDPSRDTTLHLEKGYFNIAGKQRCSIREFGSAPRIKREEGDLVLKRPMGRDKGGKMAANWERPFRIQEAFEGGAYRLETMEGETLHSTWNIANLIFYYS
ncbi:hypothetical protein TSUD_218280 [Trifolium subterraneum]|uniref:Reverse transcriptase RNase H-like domain-containing protein n=1 Tax=Trifolium subterraneum TaxID=3900 RepID=A0A2Z6N8K4_TRISU|nr:hypothetical protein TSUD_218280 [Trifolium subterraneum]